MKNGAILLVFMVVVSCSDNGRRQEVLKKSGELEVAWTNLDQECMSLLDTMRSVIHLWKPDSLSSVPWRKFMVNDSIMKIFNNSYFSLQSQFVAYERKVIDLKRNLHSFLSWKLLVNNRDIETSTAADDLKKYKLLYDSLSTDVRKSSRINTSDVSSFKFFVQSMQKAAVDTIQNE